MSDFSISEPDADVNTDTGIRIVDCVVAVAGFIVDDDNLSVVPVRRNLINDFEIETVIPEERADCPARAVPAAVSPVERVTIAPVGLEELVVKTASVPVATELAAITVGEVVTASVVVAVEVALCAPAVDVVVALSAATAIVLPWLPLGVPIIAAVLLVTAAALLMSAAIATVAAVSMPVLGECWDSRKGEHCQ
jgi:hypothetical protein